MVCALVMGQRRQFSGILLLVALLYTTAGEAEAQGKVPQSTYLQQQTLANKCQACIAVSRGLIDKRRIAPTSVDGTGEFIAEANSLCKTQLATPLQPICEAEVKEGGVQMHHEIIGLNVQDPQKVCSYIGYCDDTIPMTKDTECESCEIVASSLIHTFKQSPSSLRGDAEFEAAARKACEEHVTPSIPRDTCIRHMSDKRSQLKAEIVDRGGKDPLHACHIAGICAEDSTQTILPAPVAPNPVVVRQAPQVKLCPNDCSRHGVCDHVTGVCRCDEGYSGADCSVGQPKPSPSPPPPVSRAIPAHMGPVTCNGPNQPGGVDCVGDCQSGKGYCYLQKESGMCRNCVLFDPNPVLGEELCSLHGTPMGGPLPGTPSWGPECGSADKVSLRKTCPNDCSGHGKCDDTTNPLNPVCKCNTGWTGVDCSLGTQCDIVTPAERCYVCQATTKVMIEDFDEHKKFNFLLVGHEFCKDHFKAIPKLRSACLDEFTGDMGSKAEKAIAEGETDNIKLCEDMGMCEMKVDASVSDDARDLLNKICQTPIAHVKKRKSSGCCCGGGGGGGGGGGAQSASSPSSSGAGGSLPVPQNPATSPAGGGGAGGGGCNCPNDPASSTPGGGSGGSSCPQHTDPALYPQLYAEAGNFLEPNEDRLSKNYYLGKILGQPPAKRPNFIGDHLKRPGSNNNCGGNAQPSPRSRNNLRGSTGGNGPSCGQDDPSLAGRVGNAVRRNGEYGGSCPNKQQQQQEDQGGCDQQDQQQEDQGGCDQQDQPQDDDQDMSRGDEGCEGQPPPPMSNSPPPLGEDDDPPPGCDGNGKEGQRRPPPHYPPQPVKPRCRNNRSSSSNPPTSSPRCRSNHHQQQQGQAALPKRDSCSEDEGIKAKNSYLQARRPHPQKETCGGDQQQDDQNAMDDGGDDDGGGCGCDGGDGGGSGADQQGPAERAELASRSSRDQPSWTHQLGQGANHHIKNRPF